VGVDKSNFGDGVSLVSEVDALRMKSWSLLEGRFPGGRSPEGLRNGVNPGGGDPGSPGKANPISR